MRGVAGLSLAAAAAMFAMPTTASAQEASASVESRIQAMEAELAAMRAELQTLRAREQDTRDDVIRLARAAPEAPVAAPAPAPVRDGFQVGQTNIRLSGYIKLDALLTDYGAGDAPAGTARDFYVPGAVPVGGQSESDPSFDMHAKQTRFALTATRAIEGHTLVGYLEGDFQAAPGTQGS